MGGASLTADNDGNANASLNWTAPNTGEVEIIVVGPGTDTDALRHLGKGSDGTGYTIVGDKAFEITAIEHGGLTKLAGDPISLVANVRRTRTTKHPMFNVMKLNILTTDTNIQLEVF